MALIAAGIIGGAALSAGGGAMAASGQNRAGRAAQGFSDMRTMQGQQRLLDALYGGNVGSKVIRYVPGVGYVYTQPDGTIQPGGATFGTLTPTSDSILGRQQAMAELYSQRAKGIEGQFEQGAAGLDDLYRQSEGLAAQYGAGGEKLIDQETERQLTGANRRAKAQLTAAGFGNSTAVSNQQSQNAINAARGSAEAKLGLRGEALSRRLGVRGQRAGATQQNLGRRADLYTSLLGNEMNFRQLPVQTEYAAATSPIMNPWVGQNTTQFYPGASAGGTALTTGGNALGLYSSYLLGQQQGGGQSWRGAGGNDYSYGVDPSGYGGLYESNRPR